MSKSDITYIKSLKTTIEQLSKWESSGEAFGFIKTVDDSKDDYIYEFFCVMTLLNDLNDHHEIILVRGLNGFVFPKKPASKANFARFIIKNKITGLEEFQVCLGIEIKITSSPKTKYAADLSFQKAGTGDDPYDSDIVLIMDAKYKVDKGDKLAIGIIREFAQCVRDMGSPAGHPDLVFLKLGSLKANCLFTNGLTNNDHDVYCKVNNLKQIGCFDNDGRTMVVVG